MELQLQVLETTKQKLGEKHPDTLTSMTDLALTYIDQGRWKRAEKLMKNVVALQVELLPKDGPIRLRIEYVFARSLQIHGQVQRAIKLLKNVVTIETEELEEDFPDGLTADHTPARLYEANDQVDPQVLIEYAHQFPFPLSESSGDPERVIWVVSKPEPWRFHATPELNLS